MQIFWPFYPEINIWGSYTPPAWWYNKFESALEFGMIAVFLLMLGRFASKQGTNIDFLPKLKIWTWIEVILFITFLVLVYMWSGYFLAFGALYILSLGLTFGITIRMRDTVEAIG